MKRAIVTTTINKPTKALKKFVDIAFRDNWALIIVGDLKTPHQDYIDLAKDNGRIIYLSPEHQSRKYPELSEAIGWNCIQRRNIGFIEAYNWGAEYIATVDDDNIPMENWGRHIWVNQQKTVNIYKTEQEVFDPLSIFDADGFWHRGFPIQLLGDRPVYLETDVYLGRRKKVLVQADLWNGEPDVDAIYRIAQRGYSIDAKFPNISNDYPYAGSKPGPFNSQNTILSRDCFPHYFLYPHVGRMDDIWSSYVLQHQFPDSVIYGPPTVFQQRNEHDLSKDLEAELLGYKYSLNVALSGTLDGLKIPNIARIKKAEKLYKEAFNT